MEEQNRIDSSVRPLHVQRNNEGSFDDNDHESPTAPSIRKREFYDFEIIHQTTVRIERPLKNIDLVKFAYFVLVVFLFSGLCLVTEGSVPLAYILPAVSFISILSFCLLKL